MKFAYTPLALSLTCLLAAGSLASGFAQAQTQEELDLPVAEPADYNPDLDLQFAREYYAQNGMASPAEAASPTPKPAPRPVRKQLVQVDETETVQLMLNQGRLLQLPRAAATVMVANPEIASYQVPTPGSVFVFAKAPGTTTLYALDGNDEVISAIRLVASQDMAALGRLGDQIAHEIPGAKVEFLPSGSSLIVRGSVRTPQQAKQVMDSVEANLGAASSSAGGNARAPQGGQQGQTPAPRVINQLKVELSAQVNISVRIVEVSRSLSTSLGLNWDVALKDGNYFLRNGASLFDATTGAFSGGTATNAVAGGFHRNGSTTVAGLLTALSEDGLATVLAEPNLTAMSGETAGFAAGGEVPIVTFVNNSVNIDYKQYGVIMRMTPTLLSPKRISLHVAPEVSDLSNDGAVELDGFTIPAFKVRRADTTVELASGQSFALAGMLRSNLAQQINGVPGLKSIPGLGRLFETETNTQEDTELVIIATAYVVEPTAPGDLQTPGRGIRALDAQLPAQATAGYLF
ncbi:MULTISPECIES: type II and III secretion system protein family protein [Pseudomonas]|uniref:Pilus assembly protein CpaC n=1 Tax=Phytopseudomonas flavescens TaxID=29435 RepID=A0A7Z0BR73_9GAMM|nr:MULTISPECIES: type II and III secretion system protein family protein [Pseudomonas]MCW2291486.1 pilus assembly protein CpaC [Pseudomonas sp. BIGb0408]NYH73943.1 pilus assembly protein CpaC [Pseudomonas flavescens]